MPNWGDKLTLSTGREVEYTPEAGCCVDKGSDCTYYGGWQITSGGLDFSPEHLSPAGKDCAMCREWHNATPLLPSPAQLSTDRAARVREVWELLFIRGDVAGAPYAVIYTRERLEAGHIGYANVAGHIEMKYEIARKAVYDVNLQAVKRDLQKIEALQAWLASCGLEETTT